MRWALRGRRRTGWCSWPRAACCSRGRRRKCLARPRMRGRARLSGGSASIERRMTGFAGTFLTVNVMARSLPAVAGGFVLTVELALLVVATGLVAGLALALVRTFGVRPLSVLIVFVADLFRAVPPL